MEENIQLPVNGSATTRVASARIGDIVTTLLQERIAPKQAKYGPLVDAWARLLPSELQKHCRLADLAGGRLKVAADSSAYVYELQLCSAELLRQLQQSCPAARLTKIKVILG